MWIEVHQSVWSHRKILILASELEIDETYAAAHMIRFWTWALDNAMDGDISGLPARVIAYGAGWKGDPEKFVDSAVKSGLFDRTEGGLFIHDWEDYARRLIERRAKDTAKKKDLRRAYEEGVIAKVKERDGDKCRYCGKTVDWTNRRGPDGGTYAYIDLNGPSTVDNLVVCCRACAKQKSGAKPGSAFNAHLMRTKSESNSAPNAHLINLTIPNLTKPKNNQEEEGAATDNNSQLDPAWGEVCRMSEEWFGRVPNPLEVDMILGHVRDGMEMEAVSLALHEAASRGKDLHYAQRILDHWAQKGIKTKLAAQKAMADWKGAKKGGGTGRSTQKGSPESISELSRLFAENSL